MTVVQNKVPLPLQDRLVGLHQDSPARDGYMTESWVRWFDQLGLVLEGASVRVASVELSAQQAGVPATNFVGTTLSAGLYRATYYVRVTQPATVASSVQVTLDWTEGGVTPNFTGALVNGNTTTSFDSATQTFLVGAGQPVRYTLAYASVGATPMQYLFQLVLEEVRA